MVQHILKEKPSGFSASYESRLDAGRDITCITELMSVTTKWGEAKQNLPQLTFRDFLLQQ